MNVSLELTDEQLDALAERVAEILGRRRWAEIEATAEYLGVDVRRVHGFRERGMPAKKIGNRLLFDLRAVDAWVERQG